MNNVTLISNTNIRIIDIPLVIQRALILGPRFIYNNYIKNENIIDKIKRTKNTKLKEADFIELSHTLNKIDSKPTNEINLPLFRKEMDIWLRKNNLIIQNSDKNLCTTLIDKDIYNNALQQLLNDKSNYKPITYQNAMTNVQNTYRKIYKLYEKFRKLQYLHILLCANVKFGFPNLYLIPKIHKPKLAFRPIVNQRNFIFTELYKQIHTFWHNKLKDEPLKDSLVLDGNFDFLLKIEQLNKTIKDDNIDLSDYNIMSLDVTNLYGNIDLREIVKCLGTCYDYRGKAEELLMFRLTEIILFGNIIESNDQLYLQQNGLAMGINYAPSLANIYLYHRYDLVFKNSLYKRGTNRPILFYGRYLDDILIIYRKTWKISGFVDYKLNKIHPSIQFTTEMNPNNVINFLDLTLSFDLNNNEITYKNYTKPLKVNTMLHAKAAYKQKAGLIKSQSIRLMKNDRNEIDYNNDIEQLRNELQTRGYHPKLINDNIEPYDKRAIYMDKDYIRNKASTFEQNTAGKKRVVLDHHSRIDAVKSLIRERTNNNVYFIHRNYANLYNSFFTNRKNTKLLWQYTINKIRTKAQSSLHSNNIVKNKPLSKESLSKSKNKITTTTTTPQQNDHKIKKPFVFNQQPTQLKINRLHNWIKNAFKH